MATTGAFDVSDKVVVVTGGCRGLGRDMAACFLSAGANVVTACRHEHVDPPEGLDAGERMLNVRCDVREPEQVDALVTDAVARFARIDVLINNAGGSPAAAAATASPNFFTKVIATNLVSVLIVSQRVNAQMQQQDAGGSIVNIASAGGLQPAPGLAAYGAAKAGVINVTRTLAVEWGPKVRVNCIAPGFIFTEGAEFLAPTQEAKNAMAQANPLKRLGMPRDISGVCVFLASAASSFINGETILVDGGPRSGAAG